MEKLLRFLTALVYVVVICVSIFAIVATLTGCESNHLADMATIKEYYVDEVTGVNYICVYSADGMAITPRYSADGTLYISHIVTKEQTND